MSSPTLRELMNPLSPAEIASTLSPVQFEQVVQHYIANHMQRAGLHRAGSKELPSVFLSSVRMSNQWHQWQWTIGSGYDGQPRTEGEIFAMCCVEHGRRQQFAASAKLLQIEAEEPPIPEIDDEIPF